MWDVAGLPPFRRNEPPQWLTEAHIRRSLRSGDLIIARRGVIVGRRRVELDDDYVLAAQIAIAGLRGGSKAAACLGTAAVMHGFARLGRPPKRVRLYRERGGPWRDDEVAVLVCGLPPEHVAEVNGVPSTTPARTVVDLSRWVGFRGGVVIADSAMAVGVTRAELDGVLQRCHRWPGVRKARRVVEFADGRAATPLESVSRVAFAELGLPEPRLQVTLVWDEAGNPKYIVDFYWEEFRVVGEADGLLKYDDPLALRAEKLRQEDLEARGYIVVRWTWDDIWRRPEWVVARIRRAMAEGARRRTA